MTSITFRRMNRGTQRFFAIGFSFLLTISLAFTAQGGEIVHEVKKGQNLGMIAKRYHTSAQAIREANKLSEKKHIYPGQKLRIALSDEHKKWLEFYAEKLAPKPKRKRSDKRIDKSGDRRDKQKRDKQKRDKQKRDEQKRDKRDRKAPRAKADSQRSVRAKGEPRSSKKRSRESQRAARSKPAAQKSEKKGSKSAEPNSSALSEYSRKPRQPGFVTLQRLGRTFTGQLLDEAGNVEDAASKRADRFMRSWRTGETHEMDRRLYRLLAQVSDAFGGRKIVVISGFRPFRDKQFTKNSRHNHGKAIDFRVVGVPIRTLFDYCRGFRDVGCGHYPNSGFIHMDVREHKTHWTDYSRPGQAPIYAHKIKKQPPKPASAETASRQTDDKRAKKRTRARRDAKARAEKARAEKRSGEGRVRETKNDERAATSEPKRTAGKSKSGRGGGKAAKKPD